MATVYVLLSKKTGKKYIGSTQSTAEQRLTEHNAGKMPWTRAHRPLELIYSENLSSMELAGKRERFLKTGKGRGILQTLLKKS